MTSAPSEPTGPLRLVGFNVDLLDALGTLVASDSFLGLLGDSAVSDLAVAGLAPGDYRLRISGVASGAGDYNLFLAVGGEPPPTTVPEPEPVETAALALLLFGALAKRRARFR